MLRLPRLRWLTDGSGARCSRVGLGSRARFLYTRARARPRGLSGPARARVRPERGGRNDGQSLSSWRLCSGRGFATLSASPENPRYVHRYLITIEGSHFDAPDNVELPAPPQPGETIETHAPTRRTSCDLKRFRRENGQGP
jgi:hypothetical protein